MDVPKTTGPTILWVTDPWATLDHPRDTTLRLIEEAVTAGVESYWADVRQVRWTRCEARLDTHAVLQVAPGREAGAFRMAAPREARPSHFDIVLYRPDPPVDLAYLHPLQWLALDVANGTTEGRRTRILNHPDVLLGQSEKLAASFLPERMPPTLAASQWETLCRFGEEEGTVIAKPIHQCQSKDVERLDFRSASGRAWAEQVTRRMTDDFRRPCVLQRFLPEVLDGETRLWLLDGRVLACARKRAADGGYRIDMDKGGRLGPHVLTERETTILPELGRWLREHGVRLAAVDLIDGWITDFNFTSPGLLTNMEAVTGRNLARPIIEALAAPSPRVDLGSTREDVVGRAVKLQALQAISHSEQ